MKRKRFGLFPAKDKITNTLLLAEDEEENIAFAVGALKRIKGLKVIVAKNGHLAVDSVMEDSSIDVVLMDLKMPVMDGFEATVQIKNIRPELPVIALSAYAFAEYREKAYKCGCDEFLAKPIAVNELVRIVTLYIDLAL